MYVVHVDAVVAAGRRDFAALDVEAAVCENLKPGDLAVGRHPGSPGNRDIAPALLERRAVGGRRVNGTVLDRDLAACPEASLRACDRKVRVLQRQAARAGHVHGDVYAVIRAGERSRTRYGQRACRVNFRFFCGIADRVRARDRRAGQRQGFAAGVKRPARAGQVCRRDLRVPDPKVVRFRLRLHRRRSRRKARDHHADEQQSEKHAPSHRILHRKKPPQNSRPEGGSVPVLRGADSSQSRCPEGTLAHINSTR